MQIIQLKFSVSLILTFIVHCTEINVNFLLLFCVFMKWNPLRQMKKTDCGCCGQCSDLKGKNLNWSRECFLTRNLIICILHCSYLCDKIRLLRWAEYIAHIGKMRSTYKILREKPDRKR